MTNIKRIVTVLIIILLVFVVVYWQAVNKNNENSFGEKEFSIEKGQGIKEIADNLQKQGFLASRFWFKVYVAFGGYKSSFMDGTYTLKTDMDIRGVVRALLTVTQTQEMDITVIEGMTVEEMDQKLSVEGVIKDGELIKYSSRMKGAEALYAAIENNWPLIKERPVTADLQGFLYPDTYRIYKGAKVEQIGKKMLDNFQAKVDDNILGMIKEKKMDFYETLILASIVEKEVAGFENRKMVANVFQKRIETGMGLQADSTVNFITKSGRASSTRDDLKIDNPYNTYKYRGLPPGPICNPSIEAIRAVVEAEQNPYWYFLTDEKGAVYFAKTHEEHVQNKFKYLK